MERNNGNLIAFRPDIKVVDCTLRDGGLVNNFAFTDEFVKDLYRTNIKAGVDYMEFGYKASKDIFSKEDYGKWKFCEEEDIRAVVGNNDFDLKIAVMTDVGRTDYKNDILKKEDSVIDLVRTATYIHQIPTAIEMIQDAHEKGYETTVNIMAISKVREDELQKGLEILAESDVDVLYLFQDGRGSMNTIIPLMHYLEDLFGRRVDLVSLNYISPLIEEYVKADAILCG